MNRNNHCNQDHLEVVKVMLPVAGPSLKIKKASPGGDACRPSCRCHPSTVAAQDGEHKCRTALFPHGTGPADPFRAAQIICRIGMWGRGPLASGNLERGPASDRACQLG